MIETTLPGTQIEMLLDDGSAIQATYHRSTDNEINVQNTAGAQIVIAKQQVREIRRTEADGLSNGLLIGLGTGAAGGAVAGPFGGGEAFWSTFGWSLGVGILVDALMAHHEVLYRAP